jgi:hypothetical protein
VVAVKAVLVESGGVGSVVFEILGKMPLMIHVADNLFNFSSSIISGICALLGIAGCGTALARAAAILEHLKRPQSVIDRVLARMKADSERRAQQARDRRKKSSGPDGDGLGGEEHGGEEGEHDGWFSNEAKLCADLDGSDVEIASDDDEPGVVEADAEQEDAENAAAAEAPDEGSVHGGNGKALPKVPVPLPELPEAQSAPPPGCSLRLVSGTLTTSPAWIGKLPHGQALGGQHTMTRAFVPSSIGQAGSQHQPNVTGKKATMGEAAAQASILAWLWRWHSLDEDQKDREKQDYDLMRPSFTSTSSGVSAPEERESAGKRTATTTASSEPMSKRRR